MLRTSRIAVSYFRELNIKILQMLFTHIRTRHKTSILRSHPVKIDSFVKTSHTYTYLYIYIYI